jgi:hypothetical protein
VFGPRTEVGVDYCPVTARIVRVRCDKHDAFHAGDRKKVISFAGPADEQKNKKESSIRGKMIKNHFKQKKLTS